MVHPAAGFVHLAKRRGALTVEVNPEATTASALVDVAVQRPAEEVLPELEQLLTPNF